MAFSQSGRFLGQVGRRVVVYDVPTRTRVVRSEWHYPHPAAIAFGKSDDWFAVRSTTGAIAVARIPTGEPLSRLSPPSDVADDSGLFVAPADHLVEACSSGTLRVRQVQGLRVEYVEQHPDLMLGPVATSPDRLTWVFALGGKQIEGAEPTLGRIELRVWPFTIGTRTVLREEAGVVAGLALSPDGDQFAILERRVGDPHYSIALASTRTGSVLSETASARWSPRRGFAWSSDGKWIIVGSGDGHDVLDSELRPIGTLKGEYSSDVAFSPDASLVALGYWGHGLVLPTSDLRRWFAANVDATAV